MIRKNFHEYLFSQQNPDDIYSQYRQQKKIMHDRIIRREAEKQIKELSAEAFKKVIEDILNPKKL